MKRAHCNKIKHACCKKTIPGYCNKVTEIRTEEEAKQILDRFFHSVTNGRKNHVFNNMKINH